MIEPGDIRLRLPYFGGLRWARQEGPEHNPFWPLPRNYDTMSPEAQKEARLRIVTNHRTPEEMVIAWDTFRRLYLMNTEPGFFYHKFSESPPFHYVAVYDLGRYDRNLLAAPRGTAKSVVLGTEIPLFLSLTRPNMRTVLCLATDTMVEQRLDKISHQICNNQNILNDFGLQKPKRGEAIWNRHNMKLVNGSEITGYSVMGRKRGARPDLFILDDPEYDPENLTSTSVLREKFETLMFRQIIPMLEDGSGVFWVGTMIGSRSFLHYAAQEDNERFNYWNRRVLTAVDADDLKKGIDPSKVKTLWEDKWSGTVLKKRELEIGQAAFMSEYMNTPGSSDERALYIHPQANQYTITDYDENMYNDPLHTPTGTVHYFNYNVATGSCTPQEEAAAEFFKKLYKVITVDPAEGLKAHHDYSAISVMGFDTCNCLWILEQYLARMPKAALLSKIYKLAIKWRVKVIGLESFSMHATLSETMLMYMEEKMFGYDGTWKPRVIPVDYKDSKGPKGKADRISMLGPRFVGGQIKYPEHLKLKWPYTELYLQTENFTHDLQMLSHDDLIDSVAMSGYILHGKGILMANQPSTLNGTDELTKALKNGGTIGGVPAVSGFSPNELSQEQLKIIVDRGRDKAYSGQMNSAKELYFSGKANCRTKGKYYDNRRVRLAVKGKR